MNETFLCNKIRFFNNIDSYDERKIFVIENLAFFILNLVFGWKMSRNYSLACFSYSHWWESVENFIFYIKWCLQPSTKTRLKLCPSTSFSRTWSSGLVKILRPSILNLIKLLSNRGKFVDLWKKIFYQRPETFNVLFEICSKII